MSDRERVLQLFDTVPEYKIKLVIAYLQGLTADEYWEPNPETISAMKELEEGKGKSFDSVDAFWSDLEE